MMKVWIVKIDNHDYDFMSEEILPIAYRSRPRAELAAVKARKNWKGHANVEFFELEVEQC